MSRVESGGKGDRYVGLGSRSEALLRDVQRLLSALRHPRVDLLASAGATRRATFSYTRKDGTDGHVRARARAYDLRITGSDLERFAEAIGFSTRRKKDALEALLERDDALRTKPWHTTLAAREDDGQEQVFNLTEPLHHSYIVDGFDRGELLASTCTSTTRRATSRRST